MAKSIDNWFTKWFDSDHYHLLYQNRDEKEAEAFINRLFESIDLPKGSKVLDLACGKGRHAVQVHDLGYEVVGLDLSEESISFAKRFEENGLKFTVGDMRWLDLDEKFDLTLNLFTSFGYFENEGENRAVLRSLSNHLKKEGRIVLDYLNIKKIEKELPVSESIQRGEITFKVNKQLSKNFIIKDIEFEDKDQEYHYREFVKCLDLATFVDYFDQVGLEISQVYGDYDLNSFDEDRSDRLIMIAKFK